MLQAADRIEDLIKRGATGDVSDERLAFYQTLARADDVSRSHFNRSFD